MLVKLTGIDTTGKTTLAAALARHGFVRRYNAFDPGRRDVFAHYVALLQRTGQTDTVWDRGFITEQVYGPVLRQRSRLTARQFEQLVVSLAAVPAVVIHVWEPHETLEARLRASEEQAPAHTQVRQHLETLEYQYTLVLEEVAKMVPVLRFRPSAETPDLVFRAAGISHRDTEA